MDAEIIKLQQLLNNKHLIIHTMTVMQAREDLCL